VQADSCDEVCVETALGFGRDLLVCSMICTLNICCVAVFTLENLPESHLGVLWQQLRQRQGLHQPPRSLEDPHLRRAHLSLIMSLLS